MLHNRLADNCTSTTLYGSDATSNTFISSLVQENLQPLMQELRDTDAYLESLQPAISRIAYGILAGGLHRGVERDDLMQEGLLAVWQCTQHFNADKTPSAGAFKGYCLTRARGAMVDYLRKHYRTGGDSIDLEPEQWLMVPAASSQPVSETPIRERKRINAALNKLSRLERLAIKGEYGFCRDVVCHGGPYMTRQAVQRYFKSSKVYYHSHRKATRKLATLLQPC